MQELVVQYLLFRKFSDKGEACVKAGRTNTDGSINVHVVNMAVVTQPRE